MVCRFCGAQIPDAPFCCACGSRQEAITLGQLHSDWTRIHYRRIGSKGIEGYETAWRVLQILQACPVASLTLEDYQDVMDSISDYSLSKQQKLRQLISQLCQYAEIRKIDERNYAPFLVLDGYHSKSRVIFSDEEIARLYFYAQDSNNKYWDTAQIVLLLIFTGLRPEELFEVKKQNVDGINRVIRVEGSKTEAGRNRIIPILPVISGYITFCYFTHKNCPYLLTSPQGCRIHLGNWRKRRFYPLMRELGINTPDNPHRIVPYCTRHTYASLAKRAGVDVGILAKMIGHADPKTTEDHYIHETIAEMQCEASKVGQLAEKLLTVKPAVVCRSAS